MDYLKVNFLEHRPLEIFAAGQFCVATPFFDLEAVESDCESSLTIDQCANFHDNDFSGVCEPYVALCNSCEPLEFPASDDLKQTELTHLVIDSDYVLEQLAAVKDFFLLASDCETVDLDYLGNLIVELSMDISDDDYKKAQAALRCEPYGDYVPEPDCAAYPQGHNYETWSDNAGEWELEALVDSDESGEADGLDFTEGSLVAMGDEILNDILDGWGDDPYDAIVFLEDAIIEIHDAEPCPDFDPGDANPHSGHYWNHPWAFFDFDGDGFPFIADCDDSDPEVHPGAIEICNGKDDDCDGTVDEGFDADEDGYTTCNGDCNDRSAKIHPGADETPNDGIDSNCNNIDNCGTVPLPCRGVSTLRGVSSLIVYLVPLLGIALLRSVYRNDRRRPAGRVV